MTLPVIFKLATQIAAKGAKSFRHPSDPLKLGPARGTRGWTSPSEPTGLSKLYEAEKLGLTPPHEYRRMAAVDEEVILDAPLSRSERDYFAGLSKMKENYFGDMSFDVPPNKRDLSIKSNVRWLLRNLGIRNKNHPDYKETIQDLKDLLKDVKEFKHGGGLSSINKPITINGQRHNLAWINPDEASALKAMGGSGKPGPMGIPSYQETDTYSNQFDDYVAEDLADTVGPDEGGYSWDWGETGGYAYPTGEGPEKTGYLDQELRDYASGLGTTVRGLGPIGTERAKAEHHDTLTDMRKGFLGRYGDRMTRGELEQSVYNRAFNDWFSNPDNRRQENAVDKFHSMFQKGMRGGGAENILTSSNPLGELYKQNERMIETALKARQERNLAKIELFDASDEEFAQHKKEALLDAAKNIVDDFQPYKGTGVAKALSYLEPIALKGIRGAMGLISDTEVIGTGTVNGQGVHVHSDGSITYVSPESAPDYDWTGREGGVDDEILDRRKLPRRPIAAAPVEKPKTGMAAYYERLGQERSPTTRIASNKYLEELLASIYPTNRPTLG